MPTPILKFEANGRAYAHWSDGGRSKRKSMGTQDRAVAEKRFAQWLLLGGHKSEIADDTAQRAYTAQDCWTVYKAKHVDVGGADNDTITYNWLTLGPHFGHLTIPQVNQKAVDDYVAKRTTGRLGRKVKPQTCRKELSILFAAMRFCASKKKLGAEPMFSAALIEDCTLPAEGDPRDRWLRIEEMQRLFDAAARLRRGKHLSRAERFIWLALETAARMQAILDLTWDRVDFETGTIHYDVPGRKKTKKRRVTVAISRALRPVLERAYEERDKTINDPTLALVMGNKADVWASVQLVAIEAGFGNGQAKPERSQKPKATGISPHVFRHTAATHMARRGVPLWKIAKILGNTLAMVERVYAKWCPDSPADTVDLISGGVLEAAE